MLRLLPLLCLFAGRHVADVVEKNAASVVGEKDEVLGSEWRCGVRRWLPAVVLLYLGADAVCCLPVLVTWRSIASEV